jgi:sarcosine oxidase subunit delta
MRIHCPYCGDRGHGEFAYRGDAVPSRPEPIGRAVVAEAKLFIDYVYTRTNTAGVMQEYWQHVGGCRAWLIVERNVTTHEILEVSVAREERRRTSARSDSL